MRKSKLKRKCYIERIKRNFQFRHCALYRGYSALHLEVQKKGMTKKQKTSNKKQKKH